MSRHPPTDVQRDPFRFGWRLARRSERNGHGEEERIPLTPEDVLHPQEGDVIPENTIQERERGYLSAVLRSRLADNATALVLSDCIVNWGVAGLQNHSPDVAVFDHVADPNRDWSTFPVAAEGARPLLVIEIVSVHDDDPEIRNNDVVIKVQQYYRAGVPRYVIVDQEVEDGPRRLLAYRRGRRRYEVVSPDGQGRVPLELGGLLLGLRDNRAVCYDAATGEEIPDYTRMERVRQQAEAALAAAQARIRELEAQARPRRRPPRGRKA